MAVCKEFLEAASKDGALKEEAEQAAYEALAALLKEKGLEEEAEKGCQSRTTVRNAASSDSPRFQATECETNLVGFAPFPTSSGTFMQGDSIWL